jgi:hypothetical protein
MSINCVHLTPNMNVMSDATPGFYSNVWPLRAHGSLSTAQVTQSVMLNQVLIVVYTVCTRHASHVHEMCYNEHDEARCARE